METDKIIYKIKTANEQEICSHLKECNDTFFPPLSERVNIEEYSKKIVNNATTFEAWSGNILIGMIAAYKNASATSVFITNVSVLKKYMGFRIATELTTNCIEYAKKNNFREIKLEVHKNNSIAISLYEKFNFIKYDFNVDMDLMKLEIIK